MSASHRKVCNSDTNDTGSTIRLITFSNVRTHGTFSYHPWLYSPPVSVRLTSVSVRLATVGVRLASVGVRLASVGVRLASVNLNGIISMFV